MKNALPLLLLLTISFSARSQQVQVGITSRPGGFKSYTFNNRFLPTAEYSVYYNNPGFYKTQKIKKIELLNPDKSVCYSLDLDINGQIVLTGRDGYYFSTEQSINDSARHTELTIKKYFLQSKLVRSDSITQTHFVYNHADTLIKFTRTEIVSYWSGPLLNERNAYYNKQYLHKVVRHTDNGPFGKYGNRKRKVYLHHALKTDFDTTKIYLDERQLKNEDFSAETGTNEKKYLTPQQLAKHPFVLQNYNNSLDKFYTQGASFIEPWYYFQSSSCGTEIYRQEMEKANTIYDYSKNNKGLYDTFYSEYRERFASTSDGNQSDAGPDHTILLYFRYEYFKN